MSRVRSSMTLGALVAERPARAAVFERLRLDYCCGGAQTLADACHERRLELDAVRAELDASDGVASDSRGCEDRDWRKATLGELCAHIAGVHHHGLREAFPRIEGLLATVVRVHGGDRPELRDLHDAFCRLRAELDPHLDREEAVLFPACRRFELRGTTVDEALLAEHEREHTTTGDALATIRALAGDYDVGVALCNTHRALIQELAAFERDLHRHVHEENNILIPRARQLGTEPQRVHGSVSAADSLPRCCQAWIAEQSRGWSSRGTRGL